MKALSRGKLSGKRGISGKVKASKKGAVSRRHAIQNHHKLRNILMLSLLFSLILLLDGMQVEKSAQHDIISLSPDNIQVEEKDIVESVKEMVYDFNRQYPSMLKGVNTVSITQESISSLSSKEESCSGSHILGAYSGDTILIRHVDGEIDKRTLYHEIGHNVWAKLSDEKKGEWARLFSLQKDEVSPYSNTNSKENFAENFACFLIDFEGCREKMIGEKIRFISVLLEKR
ncbi:hypothetical protein J4212_01665 [Candidatus Woesearchaeota archaeon]|nr:hypothetical protein [Candidatus Woesearchaeota archaeon]